MLRGYGQGFLPITSGRRGEKMKHDFDDFDEGGNSDEGGDSDSDSDEY